MFGVYLVFRISGLVFLPILMKLCGVLMQAAKEFESELKTEPEDSASGSSPVAMSNKEEDKTEVSSNSKENV